jgi:uncharacterized protein GlcG (DUF336 family)
MKIRSVLTLCVAMIAPAIGQAQEPLVTIRVLSPETALEVARGALGQCRASGFQVAVAVVDRMGVTQVMLRDRYAGAHSPHSAQSKAWTAVSFRTDTLTLSRSTAPDSIQSGARMIPNVLMLGGGVPIQVAGQLVGAVGVAGASGGEEDDSCARAGIQAVMDKLELGG